MPGGPRADALAVPPPADPPRPATGPAPRWVPDGTDVGPGARTTWLPSADGVPLQPPPAGTWSPGGTARQVPDRPAPLTPEWRPDPWEPDVLRPEPWQPVASPSPPRRRPLRTRLGTILAAGALGVVLVTTVLPRMLGDTAPRWFGSVAQAPEPTAELLALVDTMPLTPAGRDLLLASGPELLDAEQFAGRCDRGQAVVRADGAVGCYVAGGPLSAARIVVYRPADERLRGFAVETLAHELLHAAWDELDRSEQETAETVLDRVVAGIDPADDLHAQLAGSVGPNPGNRATEMFAYVGTQVWQVGGLDPALEGLYARYVSDREALVAVHTALQALLGTLVGEVESAQSALAAQRAELEREKHEVAAVAAQLAEYRAVIEAQEAELAALPPGDRSRRQLAWTWRDGTPLPMAAADRTLAEARRLLVRDEADLAARQARLGPAEEALAAQRTAAETLRTDVQALLDQLDPGAR